MNLLKSILLVGLGGGIGSILRYLASLAINKYYNAPFPLATFIVNFTGCLLIGILAGIAEKHQIGNDNFRYLFITGFCGGYTTFSAFAFENVNLFRGNDSITALGYIALSVIVGIFAVWAGLQLVK